MPKTLETNRVVGTFRFEKIAIRRQPIEFIPEKQLTFRPFFFDMQSKFNRIY